MPSCLRIAVLLVCYASCAAPLFAQTVRAPASSRISEASALRVLERTETSVVYELRVDWTGSLSDAARRAENLSHLALTAVKGDGFATESLALPSLAAPVVEVLAADFDEAPYSASADDPALELYVGPPAEVVRVGMERRVPRGTFVARLLQVDPERQTVRRYRRIVAAVRFDAAREAGSEADRSGPADNPHLAVEESVLASGTWFKFPVSTEGIYRIDRAYLESLGLAPESIDPNRVTIFGNGGAPVPALNSAPRIADLAENASLVVGGGDGSFGENDAVYFYGAAPNGWRWDTTATADELGWHHFINVFSSTNYYFVRVDGPATQRIGNPDFADLPGASVLGRITGRVFVEEDRPEGMIDRDGGGSGLDWMGLEVSASRPAATVLDTVPPGLAGGTVQYRARIATRSEATSTLAFRSGGEELVSTNLRNTSSLASDRTLLFDQEVAAGAALQLALTVSGSNADRQGWIDYVEAFYPQNLRAQNDYLRFHTPGGEGGAFEFTLTGFSAAPQVWDVTEPQAIRRLGVRQDGTAYRVQIEVADPYRPRELVAFTTGSATIRTPAAGAAVPNQNLHRVAGFPDYVVVTPAAFRAEADDLAAYREADGLRPLVVEIDQIFNEFSGGLVDMRAVRDYLRFLYDRSPAGDPALRYAVLFGDGHYDFRGIDEGGDQNNWIPTYQSENSFSHSASYTSDDYYGLLDPNEGVWEYFTDWERVDVGVGRFPVRSAAEAAVMVEKVKSYENPDTQGDWRTRLTFVADDQYPNGWDTDAHVFHAELVSDTVRVVFPEANIQKIYAMTYPRVQTALGARYPEAEADILRSFNEGTLVWNYSGHGGPNALADEQLLNKEDIVLLDNAERLPILVTATCSFGRYDLISEQSGAELFFLNAGGGAAGVFTTTRLVNAGFSAVSNNLGLNRVLIEYMLSRGADGRPLRLGDSYRLTKSEAIGVNGNNRKFVFLGDPGMRIQIPERPVAITAINGESVGAEDGAREERDAALRPVAVTPVAASLATRETSAASRGSEAPAMRGDLPMLQALEQAEIEGEVRDLNGIRDTGYNGEVEITVYDAERTISLPGDAVNHTSGTYQERSDLIYRGRATVTDGVFTARFVVPRDISYSNEPGRISAYASDATGDDGTGFTEQFLIGGTSDNPIQDSEGPRVDLFLNDTTFASGGLVGTRPVLIAKLFDQNGINTVGTGVGHELLLTIDGAEQDAIELGRFYRGDLDSFQRGEVVFEMPDQSPGPHTLTLRAWDVANNATTATLDYFVEPDGELVLHNVYNYPNPTSGATRFVFEHNQPPGTLARIQVRIYTLSGRPIRTLDAEETLPAGVLAGTLVQIPWDGRDEDFDTLATGIYLYKVRVEVEREDGEKQVSERIERLAVIR